MRDEFADVLATSAHFSTSASPIMLERQRALDAAASQVTDWLAEIGTQFPIGLTLHARKGGRQSAFSPTAWLRIFSKEHSPRAMEGFYLVYLFAADGSSVWLSLNQGTSEFRSNHMRPINDGQILRSRASAARRALADFEDDDLLRRMSIAMDLRWAALPNIGSESRRRIRNYEDANIYALRYAAHDLPSDQQLLADLTLTMPYLMVLYEEQVPFGDLAEVDAGVTTHHPPVTPKKRDRQGPLMNSQARLALELYAEVVAMEIMADWTCQRVGHLKLGYDLDCRRGKEQLHIEVKGTTTRGEEVILTPNEVRHAYDHDCAAQHALFVLSGVQIELGEGGYRCSGGRPALLNPWELDHQGLTPTEYVYRLPRPLRDV